MLKTVEPAVEKTTNMPSKEQLALSFGNTILALQETYHKKAGEYLEAVARHEYVEELHALAEKFGTVVQRKAEADERGIENVPAFVSSLIWADRKTMGEVLIKLSDEALKQVKTEAHDRMWELYEKRREERSKEFLSLFRGELRYEDMYFHGAEEWEAPEFKRFAYVEDEASAILKVRPLLRET